MTALTLYRTGRHNWVLKDGADRELGRLDGGRGLRSAQLRTPEGVWVARVRDRQGRRATAGPGGDVAVEFDPPWARLAGSDDPVRWDFGRAFLRYDGRLTGPAGHVTVQARAFRGGAAVDVVGPWPVPVVLAACFVVLHRKGRNARIAFFAAVASGGSG
ncbi:hypothetical protein [Micromonospora zhanjiangensis]|uniref:Htaa protein n=1 Tax=Micromonospora zhanjiangensis TaxID=1522057 RepID=A0ABV8KMF2_9ACTN